MSTEHDFKGPNAMQARLKLLKENAEKQYVEWKVRAQNSRWTPWLITIAGAALMAFVWDLRTPGRSAGHELPTETPPESVATMIPAGYVLVPIEVSNYESLDSILGQYGVVDLYKSSDRPGGAPTKVAEHIRILRAPNNPNHFAVLATESESPSLVRYNGAFQVVVQNPKSSGTKVVSSDVTPAQVLKKRAPQRVHVEVFDEAKNN